MTDKRLITCEAFKRLATQNLTQYIHLLALGPTWVSKHLNEDHTEDLYGFFDALDKASADIHYVIEVARDEGSGALACELQDSIQRRTFNHDRFDDIPSVILDAAAKVLSIEADREHAEGKDTLYVLYESLVSDQLLFVKLSRVEFMKQFNIPYPTWTDYHLACFEDSSDQFDGVYEFTTPNEAATFLARKFHDPEDSSVNEANFRRLTDEVYGSSNRVANPEVSYTS